MKSVLLAFFSTLIILPSRCAARTLQDVADNCFISWEDVEHSISSEPLLKRYAPDFVAGAAVDALGAALAVIDSGDKEENCSALKGVRETTLVLAKGRDLNSFQKACLVKCVATNYLKYTYSPVSTACGAAKNQAVDCKGFSALADYLLDELGVPSQSVAGVFQWHAYNRIKTESGQWYEFEPQNNECEFFK